MHILLQGEMDQEREVLKRVFGEQFETVKAEGDDRLVVSVDDKTATINIRTRVSTYSLRCGYVFQCVVHYLTGGISCACGSLQL